MMKQVYLILAALMVLCLAPMPYGYFQLVRFVAMVVFGVMAYQYYLRQKTVATVVFVVLALLFQPIYKIALGRVTWNVIDVLVAVLLVALFVLEKRLEKKATVGYQQLPSVTMGPFHFHSGQSHPPSGNTTYRQSSDTTSSAEKPSIPLFSRGRNPTS